MGTLTELDPLGLLGDVRVMSQAARWRHRWQLVKWRSEHAEQFGRPAAVNCGMPAAPEVIVTVTVTGTTHVSGIGRCRSVGSCPFCAPNVRAKRSRDIEALAEAAMKSGKKVSMLTLTLPHTADMGSAEALDRLRGAWRAFQQRSGTRAVLNNVGVEGMVKVVEATYGANGWHWHLHILVVSRQVPTGLIDCWRSVWNSVGIGDQWEVRVSADLRECRSASGVGKYLAKVEGGWGVGSELTSWGGKRGKKKTSVNAGELLVLASEYGEDSRAFELWKEYELSTKGCRFIEWSRGLRAKAAEWQTSLILQGIEVLGDDLTRREATDDEAAAAEEVRETIAITVAVPARTWSRAVRRGQAGILLWSILCGQYGHFAERIGNGARLVRAGP